MWSTLLLHSIEDVYNEVKLSVHLYVYGCDHVCIVLCVGFKFNFIPKKLTRCFWFVRDHVNVYSLLDGVFVLPQLRVLGVVVTQD